MPISSRVRQSGRAALSLRFAVAALAAIVVLVASGCGGGTTAKKPAPKPSSTEASATAPAVTPVGPAGTWPAQVGDFAKKVKSPVWYPSAIPKDMTIDALDVLELEPGTGLVCDIFFVGESTEIGFIQGSPKTREYVIISLGKVPWGTEKADVTYEDPEDTSSPRMIVYNSKDNLAELVGGVDFDQLKAVAASMVLVK